MIQPIYTTLKGWKLFDRRYYGVCQAAEQLAQDYLRFVEKESGAKIGMVSTGPDRDQTMAMPEFEELLRA